MKTKDTEVTERQRAKPSKIEVRDVSLYVLSFCYFTAIWATVARVK